MNCILQKDYRELVQQMQAGAVAANVLRQHGIGATFHTGPTDNVWRTEVRVPDHIIRIWEGSK